MGRIRSVPKVLMKVGDLAPEQGALDTDLREELQKIADLHKELTERVNKLNRKHGTGATDSGTDRQATP